MSFQIQVPPALFNRLMDAGLVVSKSDGYHLSRGAKLVLENQAERREKRDPLGGLPIDKSCVEGEAT